MSLYVYVCMAFIAITYTLQQYGLCIHVCVWPVGGAEACSILKDTIKVVFFHAAPPGLVYQVMLPHSALHRAD